MSTMTKEEYSKWYYENYAKKGRKKGREKSKQTPYSAKTKNKTPKQSTGKSVKDAQTQEKLSITKLNDRAKEEIKAYRKQLGEDAQKLKEKYDSDFKKMQAKRTADIKSVRQSVKKAREEREKQEAEHKEKIRQKKNDLVAEMAGMSKKDKALSRDEIRSKVIALQTEYRDGIQRIKDSYEAKRSELYSKIDWIRTEYRSQKAKNREERRNVSKQIQVKYRERLRSMLKNSKNLKSGRKR